MCRQRDRHSRRTGLGGEIVSRCVRPPLTIPLFCRRREIVTNGEIVTADAQGYEAGWAATHMKERESSLFLCLCLRLCLCLSLSLSRRRGVRGGLRHACHTWSARPHESPHVPSIHGACRTQARERVTRLRVSRAHMPSRGTRICISITAASGSTKEYCGIRIGRHT